MIHGIDTGFLATCRSSPKSSIDDALAAMCPKIGTSPRTMPMCSSNFRRPSNSIGRESYLANRRFNNVPHVAQEMSRT